MLTFSLALSGCAASLVYDPARGGKQDCQKIPDARERQRCQDAATLFRDDDRGMVAWGPAGKPASCHARDRPPRRHQGVIA